MAGVARLVIRHRRLVVGAWIVLTLVGAFSASQLSKRWFESFSIPGYSAYEANQRTLKLFGSGEQAPLVVVLTSPDKPVTQVPGVRSAIEATSSAVKGSRTGSWFETHSPMYLSKDGHTMVATIYPPGNPTFSSFPPVPKARAALKAATPPGVDEPSHRARRDLPVAGRHERAGDPRRAAGRRDRCADHPALRLRHAAGGRDPARDGGELDPDDVRVRVRAHVHHQRLDHHPVPRRARRARRRDRLRARDDLPVPRGAGSRGNRPTTRSSRR